MYKKYIKRTIDIFVSLTVLVFFSWLYVLLIILIKATSKGPAIFRQKRIGLNRKEFDILKFRTMRIDTPDDIPTHLLTNSHQYITHLGHFLRKTSLDELPQFINIFKGDMSLVGPRPALWNQFDLIEEREKYDANSILPGLTGLAQISGRDELDIPTKAKLDGEYRNNLNIILDCKIMLRTIGSVLFHKGIKEGGTVSK